MLIILIALATFVSTLVGGFVALKHNDKLHLIISFSAGVLLAVCFFDILPEIFDITQANHVPITPALIAIIVGFLTIHILEKLALIHSAHESEYADHKHPLIGVVGASGLTIHSFLDGLGIGLAFQVSTGIGLAVSLAVLAHDFCDGLNTVTLMLIHKNTRRRAMQLLVLDALAPIAGAASTLLFIFPQKYLVLYLGFFAGFLLYISASDLLPEAHSKHSSFGMIGLTVLGVAFIFFITRFM